MTSASEILAFVNRTGGDVWLEGDKLKYRLPTNCADLLETLASHKERIKGFLEATATKPVKENERAVPRLPWELERLVSAASNGRLPQGSVKLEAGLVPDLERFVLGWAAAYVLGATEEAQQRLWDAWRSWQGSRLTA
jgi:hypothetical protein